MNRLPRGTWKPRDNWVGHLYFNEARASNHCFICYDAEWAFTPHPTHLSMSSTTQCLSCTKTITSSNNNTIFSNRLTDWHIAVQWLHNIINWQFQSCVLPHSEWAVGILFLPGCVPCKCWEVCIKLHDKVGFLLMHLIHATITAVMITNMDELHSTLFGSVKRYSQSFEFC